VAISSRGFNNYRSNKLLVLRDGRTLYNPMFSGVYWDVQDFPLANIERIEIIRGPGGALWGANAVDGIINIISKRSADTLGQQLSTRVGDQQRTAMYRYGARLNDGGSYRVYLRTRDNDNFSDSNGNEHADAWNLLQSGFRFDWDLDARDSLTVQGDIYNGDAELVTGYLPDINSQAEFRADEAGLSGGNMLLRWKRLFDSYSNIELQAYYDRTERRGITVGETIETFDLEFQQRLPLGDAHDFTWGAGYRRISDSFSNTFTVSFDPPGLDQDLYNIFVQDEIDLTADWRLTLGAKLEENEYTGSEFQPNARLLWKINTQRSLWTAISQSVRTPSRSDNHIRINLQTIPPNPGLPATSLIAIIGDEHIESETQRSFEIGFRNQGSATLSYDISLFYNEYDDLITSETQPPTFESSNLLIARVFQNQMSGSSQGLEFNSSWQAAQDVRLHVGYTLFNVDLQLKAGSSDTEDLFERENSSPRQQIQLRSQWNLNDDMTLDAFLSRVDAIKFRGITSGTVSIPAYTRLDVRYAWQPSADLEIGIVGHNLLDRRHPEFSSREVLASEIPRSYSVELSLRF
jgi:iron complex outermembrane receptor protein